MPNPTFDEVRKKWNLKSTLQKVKDTKNFTIEKTTRFSGRFVQIALAVFSWYFLGSQDASVLDKYSLKPLTNAMWFFSICSPIVSGFLVVVYITPWFSHGWTSRRILFIETFLDFCMSVVWMTAFGVSIAAVSGYCDAPAGGSCINFNWLMSWYFLSSVGFLYGLGCDFYSLYLGLCAKEDIEQEILLDVRRTTRLK